MTTNTPRRSPAELEIELFCTGLRVDASCALEDDARLLSRTRAGLGSGLEIVIPGRNKEVWVNVPVEEDFAAASPFLLVREAPGRYVLRDERNREVYPTRIPPEPAWYEQKTRRGTPMRHIGVLQGTYLGIYLSNACGFWFHSPPDGCKFCTTGLNVGVNEIVEKDVRDVIETARAAKEQSGVTFVHFNSGFQTGREAEKAAPYLRAMKEEVGLLVGLQIVPTPRMEVYDWLKDIGVDHLSFCYEFHNPEYFARLCPGKERAFGQQKFFDCLAYASRLFGRGRCSGEIIAGVEPIEDTLRGIDFITEVGAFPTVCVFRPTIGAEMERVPPPKYEDMRRVFAYVYEACRRRQIPIGIAPNIEVSLVVNPEEARELVPDSFPNRLYEWEMKVARLLAKPLFAWKMRRRPIIAPEAPPVPAA